MKATRRTQPYRHKAGRPKGHTLSAMLRGKPAHLPNPMDTRRRTAKRFRRRLKHRLRAGRRY